MTHVSIGIHKICLLLGIGYWGIREGGLERGLSFGLELINVADGIQDWPPNLFPQIRLEKLV